VPAQARINWEGCGTGRVFGVKMGDDGGGSLISLVGLAPSWIVSVSASDTYLPMHHKLQKISSGTSLPG